MDDLERRLRAAVVERADGLQPGPDLPDRIHARVARRRRQRQVRAGALATVLLIAAAGGLLARLDGPRDTEAADPSLPAPTSTTEPTRPPGTAPGSTGGPGSTPPGSGTTAPGPDADPGTGTGPDDPGSGGSGGTGGTGDDRSDTAAPPGSAPTTAPPGTGPSTTAGPAGEPDVATSPDPGPAVSGCAPVSGTVVVITLRPDAPSPRCAAVRADQSLRVRNTTGGPVDVSLAHHAATVPAGGSRSFAQPFGDYLQPGVHPVTTSLYGAGDPELHLGS